MSNIYLVRHAESEMNLRTDIIGGRSNETPITELGIEQAKKLGELVLDGICMPDEIYVSPALRTRQTAYYALEASSYDSDDIGIYTEPRIQELDQGGWTKMPRELIYNDKVIQEITAIGKDFKPLGGESMNDVGLRMLQWVESLDAENEKNFLAFSHGFAIKCLASYIHNWSHEETYKSAIPNTSVSTFTNESGEWQLKTLGV